MEAHDDHFSQDTKDPDLLRAIGGKGWVLLTQDQSIRYRTPERDAYLDANVRVFVVATGNLTGKDTAEILLKARAKIERTCGEERGPFVYSIHKNSTVHRLD